jgi:hypothetical protein
MSSFLFHLLFLLLLRHTFRRDKDVPEFVVIGKGFFPFYADLLYHPYHRARVFLVKTVYPNDVVNRKIWHRHALLLLRNVNITKELTNNSQIR